MKKLVIITAWLSILFAEPAIAASMNNMFIIHHSDTSIDAFLFNEIDSIRYSNIGLDSIENPEVTTQEIWTADSVYRYAITEIDSISFQMPPTIEKENTINLADENIEKYIISSDSTTILFKSSTPDASMPKAGTRLYAIYPSEKLPYGFLGEVTAITPADNGIEVMCEPVDITDVFIQFYGGISSEGLPASPAIQGAEPLKTIFNTFPDIETDLPPVHIKQSYPFPLNEGKIDLSELPFGSHIEKDSTKYSNECALDLTLNINPHVKISYLMAINPLTTYERIKITLNAGYDFNMTGKISSNFNIQSKPFLTLEVPTGFGTKLNIPIGLFLSGEATAGIEYNYSNSARLFADIAVTRATLPLPGIIPLIKGSCDLTVANGEHSIDFSLSGNIRGGFFMEPGVALLKKYLLKLGCRAELGMELSGESLFFTSDILDAKDSPALYQRLQETGGITLRNYSSLQGTINVIGKNFEIGSEIKYTGEPRFKVDAVPKFSVPRFKDNDKGTATISYNIDGTCLMPKKVGIAIIDRTGTKPMQTLFFGEKYFNQASSFTNYSLTFDYNKKNNKYKIYPIVEISPIYNHIMGIPAWPPIDGNIFYPFIYHNENQAAGINATSGMPNIESAADNGTSLQEGNYFPFNKPQNETEQ